MKWKRRLLCGSILLASTSAGAMYLPRDVQPIPLARLTRNLRMAMEKEPANPMFIVNLARAYAMAWSQRSDSVWAVVSTYRHFFPSDPTDSVPIEPREVFFGYEYPVVPFTQVKAVTASARLALADARLDSALSLYAKALAIAPGDASARMGRAWLLTFRDKKQAIKELRALTRLPVSKYGWSFLSEASGYLIPLLDPKRDKKEIQSLNTIIAEDERQPRVVTPIAIPLRAGLEASDIENRTATIRFDADGTGLQRRWSWIRPNAGWLVHDPQHRGRVTSALQMFGSVTFWMFWSNGYDALCSLDDNRDGQLTGGELAGLALWVDVNQNGVSEHGEVRTVQQYGIVALSCKNQRDAQHPDRIAYAPSGVTFRNGATRPTFDIILHQKPDVVVARRH